MKATYRNRHRKLPARLKLTSLLLIALAATSGNAMAGTCTELPATFWNCTGAAGADASQNLNAGAGALTVTTSSPFGITTAVGNAFNLTATTGITFTNSVAGAVITGDYSGIVARNTGAGAISIDTGTAIVTGTNGFGIDARNTAVGTDISITTGDVSGAFFGILGVNYGTGATTINSTAGNVFGVNFGQVVREVGEVVTCSKLDIAVQLTVYS